MVEDLKHTDIYKYALLKAFEDYQLLIEHTCAMRRQVEELERELSVHRMKIAGLANLVESIPEDSEIHDMLMSLKSMGLTDAVREVLKAGDRAMTPLEVRDSLLRIGYDLSVYKNVQAVIHTALKRLADRREIEQAFHSGTNEPIGLYFWLPSSIAFHDPTLGVGVKRAARKTKKGRGGVQSRREGKQKE